MKMKIESFDRVEFAKNVLCSEENKQEYIIFPQTINGITYYNREQLEEDLIELRHFYLNQIK